MVDRADLNELNELYQEMTTIEQAFVNLDAGGRIVAMTIGGGPPEEMPYHPWVNVQTAYISYPPQMIDAIRQALEARHRELEARLEELGLTGI